MQKNSNNTYYIYGKHPVIAALKNPERKILSLIATESGINKIEKYLSPKIKVRIVDEKYLSSLLPQDAVHQNIILEVLPLQNQNLNYLLQASKEYSQIIVLDQVSDPHNVGAILRSAAAFSADAVIIQSRNSPQETAIIAKVAAGALELVPLISVANIVQCMKLLKENNYWCIGMDGEANSSLTKAGEFKKVAFIMGTEGKGIRPLVQKNCDLLVKIPISSQVESLNVSNATAIALYEINRRNE